MKSSFAFYINYANISSFKVLQWENSTMCLGNNVYKNFLLMILLLFLYCKVMGMDSIELFIALMDLKHNDRQ